jgi:gas vesicle protein
MNKVFSSLKRVQIVRALVIFLAGVSMLLSTACSSTPNTPKVSGEGSYTGGVPQMEIYKRVQPNEGGMNEYSDIDPRANTSRAEAKAKGLVDNAERNVRRGFEDPREAPDKLGNVIQKGSRNLSEQAQQTAEEVQQSAKEGTRNLRRNVREAREGASEVVQDVQGRTNEAVRDTQRALDNASDKLDNRA